MKTNLRVLGLCAIALASCETPVPQDSSAFYYPSANQPAPPTTRTSSTATASNTNVPRGGYAPGSGPTAMPQGDQFMYQYNESSPFGTRSSSGVIRSSGGVQSYQTIGGVPVYPGAAIPGYVPNQPYYGTPASQQPVFVPGVGGNPGYYINPATGARVRF